MKHLLLLLLLAAPVLAEPDPPSAKLAPRDWPAVEREKYEALQHVFDLPRPLAEGKTAMIGGTSGPLAIHAGLKALEAGGSAADAAVATALAQIVLSGGSWNSFAGIFYLVYYDAETGKVWALNAGYDTLLGETDPLTIPARPAPSGRTAMVGGFMAGAEAAHRKFGKLPWATVCGPAIALAEDGFAVDAALDALLTLRRDVLARLPETRAVFFRPDGSRCRKGETFRQPALAATLRRVAADGASYMYTGDWARKFVESARAEGSKVTLEDLKRYAPLWEEPLRAAYGGNEICTLGPTEIGAVELVETMNLLEIARQRQLPHYTRSAEALYQFIRICRYGHLISWKHPVPDGDPEWSPEKRVTRKDAERAWERMKKPGWETELAEAMTGGEGHSDGIVVADARGNVAAVVHSINTTSWGNTGLFVDGVSIPDSASFQQPRVALTGPGKRFPNITNPVIVLRDGKPVLAAACIGAALHECMPQNLVNVLDYRMDPKAAVETPNFWGPAWGGDPADWWRQSVGKGEFGEAVLRGVEKLGQPVKEMSAAEVLDRISYWIGMTIEADGTRRGAVNWKINGIVEAGLAK